MDEIILREWGELKYLDPEYVLRELKKIEIKFAEMPMDPRIRNLRTNKQKKFREGREAALFCIGVSKYMGKKVFFSLTESSDYDFVACWEKEGELNYASVQLKELVPEHLNPFARLDDIISRLKKYPNSSRLIVAIHLNRTFHLDVGTLNIPSLKLAGLYTFAAVSQDQNNWVLHGDFLGNFQETPFEYPRLLE